jgi:hypothetical protein
MWSRGFWGTRETKEASREEETLRNDQRTNLQCPSDQERQAKHSTSERNRNNTINTIKSNTKKRAAVHSDMNHLARGSKKQPRMETSKGEEAGVRNPGGVEVVQTASKDDEDTDHVHVVGHLAPRMCWSSTVIVGAFQSIFSSDEHSLTGTDGDSLLRKNLMVDSFITSPTQTSSLPVTLLRSSVENAGEFQAANERLKQGFDRSLCQPSSKGDAVADARIQELEQELHILEEALKNEDEKLYVGAVHKITREATTRADGTYRTRWTTMV